ncbi:hypothetical protein VTL71DRAFT_3161 [Oculimacula yallundae]|uniref:AB hydrolase-1 domain-containing protein n=1 Tax=Oculimacula yallundae TaxID=86028 RepID=A0ABR4C865_9HELO
MISLIKPQPAVTSLGYKILRLPFMFSSVPPGPTTLMNDHMSLPLSLNLSVHDTYRLPVAFDSSPRLPRYPALVLSVPECFHIKRQRNYIVVHPSVQYFASFCPTLDDSDIHCIMSHSPRKEEKEIPLPNKNFTVPSTGNTYAYIYHPAANTRDEKGGKMKTLLFLHGFPSGSAGEFGFIFLYFVIFLAEDKKFSPSNPKVESYWRHQISFFSSLGYGILAPDLLGYGRTSKPLTLHSYTGRSMASEIISIIKYENITGPVIGIGHDFGTYLLSSLAVFYREYFSGFVYFSVPFGRPGVKSNVKEVNRKAIRDGRAVQFGYQEWFWEEETGKVIGENWESFFNLIYPRDGFIWKTHFAPLDAMKTYLLNSSPSSTSQQLGPWISPAAKAHHHASFGTDYSAPLLWYKRGGLNLGCEEEREILEKGEKNGELRGDLRGTDVLMIGGTMDPVCGCEGAKRVMKSVTDGKRLRCVDFEAGHWAMLERPGEVNELLRDWLEGSNNGGGGVRSQL